MNEKHPAIGRRVTIKGSGSIKQYDCVGTASANRINRDHAVLSFDGVVQMRTVPFDRLEIVPYVNNDPPGYMTPASFATTADEATEWFAFTMLQAGVIFQNVPADAWPEIERIMTVRGEGKNGAFVKAARAYYDAAIAHYAED